MKNAVDLEKHSWALDQKERMLAQLLEEHQRSQKPEEVLRQARISHGSTMSFHINSGYNVQPKPSLIRLQYGNTGSDGEEEEVECVAGEAQTLTPAHMPKAIIVKPAPRFGSLALSGTVSPATPLLSPVNSVDVTAAGGFQPGSGGLRAVAGSATSIGGGAVDASSGAAEPAEPQEVASNKWTIAPFPTRFLWTSGPAPEGAAVVGAADDAPAAAQAPLAPQPPAPVPPRTDAPHGAPQRGRMRRMSATEAAQQTPAAQRFRTPGAAASTDCNGGGSVSSSQVMIPALPLAPGSSDLSGGCANGSPTPFDSASRGLAAPRADVFRGGRFKSQMIHPPLGGPDTVAAVGDQSKSARLPSTSSIRDQPAGPLPQATSGVRERLPPAPLSGRGGRDPAGHRSWARMSGAGGLDPGSDGESISVAHSAGSLTLSRSAASFTGAQQQQRLRASTVHEGAGGSGLRPTPLALSGQGQSSAAALQGQGSPPGAAAALHSVAAAAAIQPPPAQEVPMRATSNSLLGGVVGGGGAAGTNGAPVDANALSLLSRVGRVQPKQPPPQEWKVDPRTLLSEMVASMEVAAPPAGIAIGGGSGYSLGVHGYVPVRTQPGSSWVPRKGTADGATPLSIGADGHADSGHAGGARTAPIQPLAFEESESAQRDGSGEHPLVGLSGAGDSTLGLGAAGRNGPPRQLPSLAAGRSSTPPPLLHAAPNTIGVGVRASARGSTPRGSVLISEALALAPAGLNARGLTLPMSPARGRPSMVMTPNPPSTVPQQQLVASPPKQPPPAGAPTQHPLSSGRHRGVGSQGSGGAGSAASSFTAGHQETVELRRARLIALGEMERPASPNGGAHVPSSIASAGGAGSDGGTPAAAAAAPETASTAIAVGAPTPARLPGSAAKSRASVTLATPAKDGADGSAGEASTDEHESIMMRMKKALSFLRRGD